MGMAARVPEIISPDSDPSPQLSGEQELMLAIINEAKRTLRNPTGKRYRHDWLEAWKWLFDDSLDLLYSFPNICYVFNKEPTTVRSRILRSIPPSVLIRILP